MNKEWKKTGPQEAQRQVKKPSHFSWKWLRLGALAVLVAVAAMLLWGGGWAGLQARLSGVELGGGVQNPVDMQNLLEDGKVLFGGAPTPALTPADLSAQRTLRETAYQQDRAALLALTENTDLTAQTREDAAARLARMVEEHQAELDMEEALRAVGFDPCLLLLENNTLTVMVKGQALTSTQSATILSLCAAHTDVQVENIRVMMSQ